MRYCFIAGLLLISSSVLAQQATPSQVGGQITIIITQWAQTIELQQKQIAELQKEIADLKAKYEPIKKPAE